MFWLLWACTAEPAVDTALPIGHDSAADTADTADTGNPGDSADSGDTGCTPQPWYADLDHDGYGDPTARTDSCDAPPGTVSTDGDCDDTAAAVNPAAVETCNDVDDDCDGAVDDDPADPGAFFADADHDGHGDPGTPLAACHADVGVVRDADDCDDTRASVYPGAAEVCDDGLDNDCDGTDSGCGVLGTTSAADADVHLTGATSNAELGDSLCALDDVDGDGIADLAAGAPGSGASWTGPGHTWVYGGLGGGGTALADLSGTRGDDEFGTDVADAGDLDGDGRSDLWVSAPSSSEHGIGASGVFLFPSPTADAAAADATVELWMGTAEYGGGALSTGDLDGDGVRDLVVGNAWGGAAKAGEVYVVSGATASSGELGAVGWTWSGIAADDQAHWNAAGDVDGDGIDDLVASAWQADDETGAAYLVHGPITGSGSFADADTTFPGAAAGDYTGRTVFVVDDLDDDGLRDLVLGAPGAPMWVFSGVVYVLPAPAAGTVPVTSAWLTVSGGTKYENLGTQAGAGDVDGDGRADLVLTAPPLTNPSGTEGAAFVFLSPAGGTLADTAADGRLEAEGGAYFGDGLAVADFDGDSVADVAVGGPYQGGTGAVYLFWGGNP